MQKGRIRQSTISQQTRCKTFSDYTSGSDLWRVWNTAECKCALEALLAGVSTKHATEQPMHLNRNKTRKIHCNTLRNFPLQGFNKHIHKFRCSRKGKHLNLTARQNSTFNPLTTNALQDFQQLRQRFRFQHGLERSRMQIRPGGTSGRGIRQTRSRTAHASEPEQNPRNPPQHIEKLPIARFQQAHSQVRMQWKRRASEPCSKAELGSQPTHNKRIARLSTTTPEVQIPTWVGTQQNANTLWRHLWQRYPPNTQQNSTCI